VAEAGAGRWRVTETRVDVEALAMQFERSFGISIRQLCFRSQSLGYVQAMPESLQNSDKSGPILGFKDGVVPVPTEPQALAGVFAAPPI
jgi:hypothetical protein